MQFALVVVMRSSTLKSIFFAGDEWRWGWQLALYIPLLVASVGGLVLPVAWGLMQARLLPPIGEPLRGWPATGGFVLIQLDLYLAALGATHLAQRWLRRSSLGALGLRFEKAWLADLAAGLGLGALGIGISVGLAWLCGWYHPLGLAWQFRPWSQLGPALLVSFFGNVQPGLLEEVVFRGYLMQTVEARHGTRWAVLASAALFALAHLGNLGDDFPFWAAMLSLFLAGWLFAWAFLVRRTLWLAIGIHFAWDWSIALLGSVGQPAGEAVLVASQVTGPPLLQGPQQAGAGLFDLLGFAVVALVLWRLGRRSAPPAHG